VPEESSRVRSRAYPTWFALGAFLLYAVFTLVPSVLGIGYAFTDWNSYSNELNWVGLDNFAAILTAGSNYLRVIGNTLLFTVATVILKTVVALALALLLTEGVRRLSSFYRVLIYLPAVLPFIVVGLIFRSILDPADGLLNESLRAVGLDALALRWLTDVSLAMWSVIAVDVWRGVGYIMVILIAGLLAIPRDYYEAASIDGASAWSRLRHITLPLLAPVLAVTTVLNLLYGLKVFDIVFVLTGGGPGRATDTVYTMVFEDFSKGRWGIATALSTLLLVVMVALAYLTIRVLQRSQDD
jgi:raffinose/stachyose/melibiose transport system permease protein